jgi:glutamate---cysteine ligase / carboxylate-amine ligase
MAAAAFTIGVEEEYQVVDPDTRELRPWADRVVAGAEPAVGDAVQPELYRSQVETHTPTCHGLDEVRAELRRLRRELVAAAERSGGRLVAAGTHPFSPWQDQPVTPKPRYLNLAEDFQALMREQVVFGCHVHVGIEDRELLVQTMNRVRVWLPVLLAVSANSPFWLGADTGYASYRAQVWNRWPMAGTPEVFASRAEHDALVESLVGTGVVREPTKLYWDVRASIRYPTLEFRVADVCATVDEAVLVAGLARALARTGYDAALAGEPLPAVRPELLRAARWRAARSGLEGELVDVLERRAVPAPELVESLLAYLGPALEAAGDAEQVQALARETLARGTGSTRQREVLEAGGRLTDVVDLLVAETARGV